MHMTWSCKEICGVIFPFLIITQSTLQISLLKVNSPKMTHCLDPESAYEWTCHVRQQIIPQKEKRRTLIKDTLTKPTKPVLVIPTLIMKKIDVRSACKYERLIHTVFIYLPTF